MIKRFILVILVLAAVFGGIFFYKYQQMQKMAAQMEQPQPPATVASAGVQKEDWTPYLNAVGSLVASQGVDVTTEVPGQVSAIRFRSGQKVEAGEPILQLDDSVDRADLDGLVAERTLAEVQFERMERLYKQQSVSRSDYDEARAKLDAARARVTAKRAVIRKKAIRAPFTGHLGIRKVDLGEYLEPGTAVVGLQALDPIYVDYSLPEHHFARLHAEQAVDLTVRAHPGQRFEGRITAINPGVDPGTRNVRIRATVDNPEGLLRPGMFAQVRTVLPRREGILTVPRTAVTYNTYGDSVFVIEQKDGQKTVQRRQIRTGEVRAGRVEVVSGLAEGETVVSAGHQKLRNGQPVQIDNTVELSGTPGPS